MNMLINLNNSILLKMSECGLIIHNKGTGKTSFTTNQKDVVWERSSLFGGVYFIDDRMLFTPSDKCIFVDALSGELLDIWSMHYIAHRDNIIIGGKLVNNEYFTTAYDYEQNIVLWQNQYIVAGVNYLKGNLFFSLRFGTDNKVIPIVFCVNIQTGELLWHFSISDFPNYLNGFFREQAADIKQIIGLYNNVLWLYVGGWHLVGLDIDTGKKVHHIENVLDLLGLDSKSRLHVNLDDTMHLDEHQGILKVFAHRYYFEINLTTLEGNLKKDFGPTWNPDWRIRRSNYYPAYPNLLFFCGYYQAMDAPNAFGIFDTEKAEIVWYDTSKDDLGYFYDPPQANDTLFAIMDDQHHLLVYERDGGM